MAEPDFPTKAPIECAHRFRRHQMPRSGRLQLPPSQWLDERARGDIAQSQLPQRGRERRERTMSKNIVLCSDGTGNRGGKDNGTNVLLS